MIDNKRDEGVIKYNCELKPQRSSLGDLHLDIELWREKLFTLKLIGEYLPEELGYGNISKRLTNDQFLITATQTGKLPSLSAQYYTHVESCNLEKMRVVATGRYKPSSESLTHYAIYKEHPQLKYIFHIHDKDLWNYMLRNNYSQTPNNVDYGTQKMAVCVKDCIKDSTCGIFAMAGHEDGIIAYGRTAIEAGEQILNTLGKLKSKL